MPASPASSSPPRTPARRPPAAGPGSSHLAVYVPAEADGGDCHRVDRQLDGEHSRPLRTRADDGRGTTGPGGGDAGFLLHQAETAQFTDEVGDRRPVQAGLLGELGTRHRTRAVEPIEDCGQIVTTDLLGRHPSPRPSQAALVSFWRVGHREANNNPRICCEVQQFGSNVPTSMGRERQPPPHDLAPGPVR